METIRCKKCGTPYYTATENLNKGKHLRCTVCAKTVYLRHDNATRVTSALVHFQRNALSLLGLVSKKAGLFGRPQPASARGRQAKPGKTSPVSR